MSKVAFLALTYSSFIKNETMSRFFDPTLKNRYNLYIHNKYDIPAHDYFSDFCIAKSRVIETEWAQYSLIKASITLMDEALKDPDNEYFVLISDSHCPLYNLETTCDLIKKHFSVMSFAECVADKHLAPKRFKLIQNPSRIAYSPFKIKDALFVSQWFTCRRNDASFFVSKESNLRKWFRTDGVTLADEMYFALVASHFGLDFQLKSNCHFNWKLHSSQKLINHGARFAPKSYEKIDHRIIDSLRNTSNLFIRKVHPLTVIDNDYIFSNE
jgi:hypothetical protein